LETRGLHLSDLSVSYGKRRILTGVSLSCVPGQIVGIVGPNGAGKSTLLRGISGLANCQGTITFGDTSVRGLAPHAIFRRGIAHVPEGRHIFSDLTVRDNLDIGFLKRPGGRSKADMLDYSFQLFPILKERQSQISGTMSGGEQQMLAVARGLMSNPSVLLIDEPSLGLAPRITSAIYAAFAELRKLSMALVLVEADLNQLPKIADELIVLRDGEVIGRMHGDEVKSASASSWLTAAN
jgi:branched-chain amino acid transport system ATP-binding protein